MISYAYTRVSTADQTEARQVVAIKNFRPSIQIENIFSDKISGKTYDRPNYNAVKLVLDNIAKAYSNVENAQTVEFIVEELDRLGRTKKGIVEELKWFTEHNIVVRVLEIPTTLMDIESEKKWVRELVNKILIEVYSSLAEQEMDKRVKRQMEGIAIAKENGKYKGRKPIVFEERKFAIVMKKWKENSISTKTAMEELNLKSTTFYRKVKEYENRV